MSDSPSTETAVFEGHGFESRPDHLSESLGRTTLASEHLILSQIICHWALTFQSLDLWFCFFFATVLFIFKNQQYYKKHWHVPVTSSK